MAQFFSDGFAPEVADMFEQGGDLRTMAIILRNLAKYRIWVLHRNRGSD